MRSAALSRPCPSISTLLGAAGIGKLPEILRFDAQGFESEIGVVVDVGGGIGLLGFHIANIAKRVFVIEANPIWTLAHLDFLYREKPKNLSFLFGAAEEFVGQINADVAIVATHSDVAGMMSIASRFAPEAIDIYGELITANPQAYDRWARDARSKA